LGSSRNLAQKRHICKDFPGKVPNPLPLSILLFCRLFKIPFSLFGKEVDCPPFAFFASFLDRGNGRQYNRSIHKARNRRSGRRRYGICGTAFFHNLRLGELWGDRNGGGGHAAGYGGSAGVNCRRKWEFFASRMGILRPRFRTKNGNLMPFLVA